MPVLLSLLSALSYGISDFIGGYVSRRTSPWQVSVVVQLTAATTVTLVALFVPGSMDGSDLAWSIAGGLGSGSGVAFLFRGLGSGQMAVVAPLSAVGAAVVPVVTGLALGERPGLWGGLGLVVALPGIWLVSSGESSQLPGSGPSRSAVVDGLLAGLGFGAMYACIAQVSDGTGLWPASVAQTASVLAVVAWATVLGGAWLPRDPVAWRAFPAGLLGTVAVSAFLVATRSGMLTVTAVLSALYPAATILMAMLVLHERVHRKQAIGLGLCGLTIALVASA